MIRTFHARPSKKLLVATLLPGTVLAVYFFWLKMALPALFFMLLLVLVVERTVHTEYRLDDAGRLTVSYGRLSRRRLIELRMVERVEILTPGPVMRLLGGTETVMLTLTGGRQVFLNPSVPTEFCHVLLKKKEQLCHTSSED